MSDEIDKKLDEACTPIYFFNNIKIESAIKRNLLLIDASDLKNIHERVLKVLDINSETSSRYFNFIRFKALYSNTKFSQEPILNEITEIDLI
jgi:hypothetical protein